MPTGPRVVVHFKAPAVSPAAIFLRSSRPYACAKVIAPITSGAGLLNEQEAFFVYVH